MAKWYSGHAMAPEVQLTKEERERIFLEADVSALKEKNKQYREMISAMYFMAEELKRKILELESPDEIRKMAVYRSAQAIAERAWDHGNNPTKK